MTNVSFHTYADLDQDQRAALLRRSEADLSGVIEKVRPIIEAVRTEGDEALVRFARDFDRSESVHMGNLKVTEAEFDVAFKLVDADVIEAIKFGTENIRSFHEEQKPETMWMKEIRPGAFAGDRFTPIQSVALYVPRGKGSFPSVTMMTSGPAIVAGVPNVAIVTPPAPAGTSTVRAHRWRHNQERSHCSVRQKTTRPRPPVDSGSRRRGSQLKSFRRYVAWRISMGASSRIRLELPVEGAVS